MGNLTILTERKKRWRFIGTTAAGAAATAFLTPWIGLPVIVLGGACGWDWFRFRAVNGIRF